MLADTKYHSIIVNTSVYNIQMYCIYVLSCVKDTRTGLIPIKQHKAEWLCRFF